MKAVIDLLSARLGLSAPASGTSCAARCGRLVVALCAAVVLPLHAATSTSSAVHSVPSWHQAQAPVHSPGYVDKRRYGVKPSRGLSMSEAISRAQSQFPGRVLSAKRSVGRSGDVVFRIKILSDSGEVRTIRVASRS